MAANDFELSIMSDEELEASLEPEAPAAPEKQEPYKGPEQRSGQERRIGPKDRREMVRFEPEKPKADRRSGKDRRRLNNPAEDIWDKRDF
ncbi:MAG TPA: hypothetical protein VKA14_06970 [Gammaproteobacteria bacterium]|nr:hypothetical protein [Gammaproteobacteria bacterium]